MTDNDMFERLKEEKRKGTEAGEKYQFFIVIAKNGEFKHLYKTYDTPPKIQNGKNVTKF